MAFCGLWVDDGVGVSAGLAGRRLRAPLLQVQVGLSGACSICISTDVLTGVAWLTVYAPLPLVRPLLFLLLQAYRANIACPNKHVSEREALYKGHLLESETYIGGKVEALESGVFRADLPLKFKCKPAAYQVGWGQVESGFGQHFAGCCVGFGCDCIGIVRCTGIGGVPGRKVVYGNMGLHVSLCQRRKAAWAGTGGALHRKSPGPAQSMRVA